ncbi:adhesion G-protein coupled receptor G5-like isoform X2 [Megalops cyprinoides]|uniref:adhesion G-protein coupled receptor G5-like isoform X2 n=1 Tax=Megalops cyprinoides TaxID=118141 RepID=UPI0018653657|nr:adhesion G-protein coupled receptor G5-like isoform X2 [Megalops cyprinoides]
MLQFRKEMPCFSLFSQRSEVKGQSLTMKQEKSRHILRLAVLLALLRHGVSETDRDFQMCGTWAHSRRPRNLWFDMKKGCGNVTIRANASTLSINGCIMGSCENSSTIPLGSAQGNTTHFCVFFNPLLDLLQVEVGRQNHTLCGLAGLQESCCTGLSRVENKPATEDYGIWNGSIKGDVMNENRQEMYMFEGENNKCKADLCREAGEKPQRVDSIEKAVMRSGKMGRTDLPCAQGSVMELKKGSRGLNVTFTPTKRGHPKMPPSVHLPPSLVSSEKWSAKVVLTYFSVPTLFQRRGGEEKRKELILKEVVGISVENEVISGLPEPVKITFHHDTLPKNETTQCASWDTRRDPEVEWRDEGCKTIRKFPNETECQCDHLTYFAILVQLKPRVKVPHLVALTYISAVCCAISVFSCIILISALTRAQRRTGQDQSRPIHRSLAVALLLLTLLFLLAGVLANLENKSLCVAMGALLHYALLCSFTWMAIEVFNAFWLIYRVLKPLPKHYALNLIGFGLPAVLIILFGTTCDVYGLREIESNDEITVPHKMCWIKNNTSGSLLHYGTNISFLACLVCAGVAMLCLVLKKVQNRAEWKQNRVAFLSLWGLSCLFGSTWGLAFLDFGALSVAVLFLCSILNSLQGFFLMLRFYILKRMWKKSAVTQEEGSSSATTKQHMLQEPEKS